MTDKLQYEGSVYLYNTGYPEELVQQSKNKLVEYGVNMSDIKVIDRPEGIPDGSIMVTIWAHNLEISKVKTARQGSIIGTNLFSIQLE
ncbi:MAG: hypothetical protein ACRD32_02885 [Nitrososphaerales archaeon]